MKHIILKKDDSSLILKSSYNTGFLFYLFKLYKLTMYGRLPVF